QGLLERHALAGELALDGSIRPAPGALAMAEGARRLGLRGLGIAASAAAQATLVGGIEVRPLESVASLRDLAAGGVARLAADPGGEVLRDAARAEDLADLRGQPGLRRALEVAAAGGHSVLLLGPPGAGKTLAARRVPGLLPPLGREEMLEVVRIAGACGEHVNGRRRARPFRAPHPTASAR